MNLDEIRALFENTVGDNHGILGVAPFEKVYERLMPVQQKKLLKTGKGKSLIVFGIFHSPQAIDAIDRKENGRTDFKAWNTYAREYHQLNAILNRTARAIAEYVSGFPIPATLEGIASRINKVEDYYGLTISQRVGAELAGIGWRGKNELIVTRERGCALRLASVICPEELPFSKEMDNSCGTCTACQNVCSFLRKKHVLKNYREQCRRFIVTLHLEGNVCGKCVKACYLHWTKQ